MYTTIIYLDNSLSLTLDFIQGLSAVWKYSVKTISTVRVNDASVNGGSVHLEGSPYVDITNNNRDRLLFEMDDNSEAIRIGGYVE